MYRGYKRDLIDIKIGHIRAFKIFLTGNHSKSSSRHNSASKDVERALKGFKRALKVQLPKFIKKKTSKAIPTRSFQRFCKVFELKRSFRPWNNF